MQTVIWFQALLSKSYNLYTVIRSQVIIPNLIIITIRLYTAIWFQVFQSTLIMYTPIYSFMLHQATPARIRVDFGVMVTKWYTAHPISLKLDSHHRCNFIDSNPTAEVTYTGHCQYNINLSLQTRRLLVNAQLSSGSVPKSHSLQSCRNSGAFMIRNSPDDTTVVFWPSTRANMPFQSDAPEGSDTSQWQVIERNRVGGIWLMKWDKVKKKIPWYTHRLMHRKRVTCELHDSYFRLMTIKHAIPKIEWPIEWALN